jgi:hypothetical protein
MRSVLLLSLAIAAPAAAQPAATDDAWSFDAPDCLVVDGGAALGFPTLLPTGLARGLSVGINQGRRLAWGARVALTTLTETTEAWRVTHQEMRARVTGSLQHDAGRGTLALRAGLGGAVVREARLRNQGMRAGLEGDALSTTAYALVPVASLDAVVAVRVRGPWIIQLAGGPVVAMYDGRARGGWSAEVGLAWQR